VRELGALNNTKKKLILELLRNARGFALYSLGRYEEALEAFEIARRFSENGKVKIACCGKGLVFAHMGDWEKTLRVFDGILVSDPENLLASVIKAFVLIRLQKFESASSILERLIEEDIDSDLQACLLGLACSRLGNFERALWAYKEAIEIKPKNFNARNGLAELYFKLGNSRGALKELEASIVEVPENAFSRNLKGRVELEEQACEDALESFRRALELDPKDRRLLLWDAYARYMCAEASFEEDSTRFRYMVIAAAGKLEKAVLSLDVGDIELKAYAFYFMGLFYCRARHFRKAAEKLEECLKLKTPDEVKKPASLLLKSIRSGPLRPSWWRWWLDTETNGLVKKACFSFIFLLIFVLLLSHPAASSIPIISWVASLKAHLLSSFGIEYISWAVYGREYLILILFSFTVLLTPALRFDRERREELELEVLTPPAPNFDIPASILDEFTESLEKNLFSPEPMDERIEKLVEF
jgi:tetratricopeptide (TPR) repeat protein